MEVRQFHDRSPQEKLSVTNKKNYNQERCTVPQNRKKVAKIEEEKIKKLVFFFKFSSVFYTSNLTMKTNIFIDFHAYSA